MNEVKIEDINERIASDAVGYIKECEKSYAKRISEVADSIKSCIDSRPIILLSGPSGAGKTTTALKLEALLDSEGIETHTISMDNYFTPLDSEQGIDLEAPSRLDTALLQKHLVKIANCEEIDIPIFNFKRQTREGYVKLKRKKRELIVIEGIHALNPDVTGYNTNFTQHIYLSPDTRVRYGDKSLRRADIRLIRRLTRDSLFRNRSFEDTLSRYKKVELGAKRYIIPFKQRADFLIDTFVPYEIGVYRPLDANKLKKIPDESEQKPHAMQLYCALNSAVPIDEKLVPSNSLVREFIGGSVFNY